MANLNFDEYRKKMNQKYGNTEEQETASSTPTVSVKSKEEAKAQIASTSFELYRKKMNEKYNPNMDVDEDYLNSFISDSSKYMGSATTDYAKMGVSTLPTVYKSRVEATSDLQYRSGVISRWLDRNKDSLDPEQYKSFKQYLSDFNMASMQSMDAFRAANDYYSQWETEEDYWRGSGETRDDRQKWYEESQQRLEELKAERAALTPPGSSSYLQGGTTLTSTPYAAAAQNTVTNSRASELDKEISELETQMRMYERGEGGYLSKVVDDYFDITNSKGFSNIADDRDFANPTREQLIEYDTMMDGSTWYRDANGNLFDAYGNQIDHTNVDEEGKIIHPIASGDEYVINDRLGLYLSASDDEIDAVIGSMEATDGSWESVINDGFYGSWDQLTETEIGIYYYLLNTDGQEAADKYLSDMTTELNRRTTMQEGARLSQAFDEASTLERIAMSVATTPYQLLGATAGMIDNAINLAQGKDINPYSVAHTGTHFSSTIRGKQAEEWDKTGFEIPVLGYSAGDIYQTGMSILDSVASIGIGGKAGGVLLSMGAAESEATRLYQQGASVEQIALSSVAAGAAELLWESVAIDSLFKMGDANTVRQVIGNALKQSGVEAIEEGATEITNMLTNAVIMGQQSDWNKMVEEAGGDEFKAFMQLAQQVAQASFGGFLSGAGMAGGPSIINYGATQAQYTDAGKAIMGVDGGAEALKQLALDAAGVSPEGLRNDLTNQAGKITGDTATGKILGKYSPIAAAKNNANAKRLGRLYETVGTAYEAQNQADIAKSLERKGLSSERANAVAEALLADMNGQDLTAEQKALLSDAYNSPRVAETIKNIIANKQSTMGQRNQTLNAFNYEVALSQLANEVARKQSKAQRKNKNAEGNLTTVAENSAESQYEVSVDGKTLDGDGNIISVKGVASIENGRMMLETEDGNTVDSSSVTYGSQNEALVYEAVASLGGIIDAKSATKLLNKFDPNGVSAEVYARGIVQAYTYGYHGYTMADAMGGNTMSAELSTAQRNTAFQLGRENKKAAVATAQATASKYRESAKDSSAPQKKGGVFYRGDNMTVSEFDSYLEKSGIKLKDVQKVSIETMKNLSEALGIEFYVYESFVENGKRYYIDENGVKQEGAPNGWYDTKTGKVYIDLHAGNTGRGTMLFTIAHELTHFIHQWSPEKFTKLADIVFKHSSLKNQVSELVSTKMAKAESRGKPISQETAYEEVVADAMESILKSGHVMEMVADIKQQDRGMWQKICDWFKDLVNYMKRVVDAYRGVDPDSVEGKAVASMKGIIKEIEAVYAEGLVDASENYQSSLTPGEEGTVVNQNGDPVAYSTGDGSVLLSMRTYEEEGRDAFRKYLQKCVSSNNLTKAEMQEMMDGIEDIYQTCKEFKDKYAPFSAWSDAAVVRDTYGKPVFSVVTPNGDYKMNLDFSLVCKKRRTLDAVFNEMSRRGIIDDFELGQKSVVKINEIIRKHGLETACALCFVDAKRFRQASMADSFTRLYNELVLSLVHEDQRSNIDHFNFSGYATIKKVEGGIDTWANSKLDFSHLDDVMRNYGKGTVEHKAAKYIKTHAEGRKLLLRGDFMSSQGFDAVKTQNKDILKLYNSKKGTGGPKAAFGDVQYMNEIIKKARTWTPAKAYSVGGVRIQSFSDYVPRMVFDYTQMIYDLAATKLPAHAYTKEALFVKQFGLTGVKINMSLIPAITEGGIAPGLDANGNYVWAGESFDYETAKEIQNAEGYTENCGAICVGVSYDHIQKLLRDPNIRMVIPYHKSGLNPIVAHMNKIAEFTDYTNDQRTKGKDGKALAKDFDFSKALHDMGKNANPKAVADQYLKWCVANGYTPRFSEFAMEDNYYKLLEDFTLYDKDGNYVPQREVRAVFPNADSAFGSMKDLIKSGLEEDAVIEGKRDSSLSSIVDEIQRTLPKTEAEIAETQVAQADRDLEAAIRGIESDVHTDDVNAIAEQVTDVVNNLKFSDREAVNRKETYSIIGKELLSYEEGNQAPDLTLVETVNERTGKTETTIKHYGQKPKNYVPKRIAYCYKLFEQHPDGTLHALFAGAKGATPIGVWQYAQGFPYTDAGVKGMNLRERYGWHLSAGLPSAPHLMSSKDFARGYPSKNAYGHPKGSKRVWVRMAYDASTDFNSIADSTRAGDIFGLIPFGGYYAFKENNQSEWVISSAVKIDKILTEDERQQILRDAGYDEYEAWRKKHHATDAEKAESKRKSAENKKAKDNAVKAGLNYLSESSKAMREAIKSRIIDNPDVKHSDRDDRTYAEIETERQELRQREMMLEERKRKAVNDPNLLQAMDDYSDLFTEIRELFSKKRNGTATHAELDRIEEIKRLLEEAMKRVTDLQESLGLNAIAQEESEIRETKEALRIASDAAWAREGAAKENEAIEKAGVSAPEYFRKKALKAFKTTTNFNEAGYLLPDGKLLNFSGGERNHRCRDHREIGEVYEATQGAAALNRFMSDGNIRIMAESPGVDITSGVEPTKEQYAAIRKFVNANGVKDGRFFVDFSDTDGHRAGNYSYEGRVNADRVINDIKHYYATGEIRVQSSVAQFRWSDRDSEGNKLSKAQQEFFKDSKVRWGENLMPVHHGTYRKFTVFDPTEGYDENRVGGLLWAAKDAEYAKGFTSLYEPIVMKGYLNITNMLDIGDIDSYENYESRLQELADLVGLTPSELEAMATYDDPVKYIYDITSSKGFRDRIVELGYDGVMAQESGIQTFGFVDSNQFKNIDNLTPTTNPDIRYQDRPGESVSNRSLLANAFEGVAQNDIERQKIQEYKGKVAMLDAEEKKLHELNAQIKELSFAKGKRDTKRIKELQFDATQTANRIATLDKMLLGLEASAPLKKILQREKEMVRKREKQKGKEALEAYRKAELERSLKWQSEVKDKYKASKKKAIETREKREAREKLQKLVLDTAKWISYPSKTDVKCPDILKQPYADFLKGIDLSSQRLAKGGEATQNDLRLANAMGSLATALEKVMASQDPNQDTTAVLDTGYLDLPANFVQKLRDMTENVKAMMVDGDYVVNNMSAAEVRQLSQMIRTLNHAIKEVSTLYANLRFANVEALGDDTMTFMDDLGEIEKTGGVKDFIQWENALPYYAFKRFGNGGESIFEGLMDAQDKLAFLAQKIFDFRENTWKGNEAKAWSEDTHTIDLPNGTTLTLTTADAMSIYCLSRRQQGLQHLLGGGVRVVGIQKGSNKAKDSRSLLTIEDIDAINSSLTDRQKQVAEAIQEFMSTTCSEWGNEISMKRFLTKEFNEKFYFPIESNDENLPTKDPAAQQSDLFRLLNISATKPIDPRANNEVIIRNVFDVFTGHASDMARLNAYGMALLDYMKWLNYREKTVNEDGQVKVRGVRKSMEKAYGNAAKSYVLNLIKDVNGRSSDGGDPTILMKWMRAAKTASVGSSLRVATLQITSYPRAALVLSPKSLALGLSKLPQIEKAKKYCGVALWKSFGFYDTNISRSIEDQMKGVKDVKQKLIELSLKGAEWGDAITWGCLWNACEYEVASTKKHKVGSEEFYKEVGNKLREVVYATQVVDSTLTRSQIMRSKRGMAQEAAAFMSEPTLSANILMDAGFRFNAEKRRTGSAKLAWKNTSKYIGRALAVYAIGQLTAALLEGLWDAWRDDDDEEFGEKYLSAFVENLALDLVPFNKIPIVSDVFEAALAMFGIGFYSSDKMSSTWLTQAVSAAEAWKEVLGGNSSVTAYNALYKTMRAISSFYGVSFSGVMREGVALWNNTAGAYDATLKILTYARSNTEKGSLLLDAIIDGDDRQADSIRAEFEDQEGYQSAIRSAIRDRYKEGEIDYDTAIQYLVKYGGLDEDEAYWKVDEWMYESESGEDYAKYGEFFTAVETGKNLKAVIQKYTSNGVSEATLKSQVTDHFKPLYMEMTTSEKAAIKGYLLNAMTVLGDTREAAESRIREWEFEAKHGFAYDDRKQQFFDGNISASEMRSIIMSVEGKTESEANATIVRYCRDGYEDGYFTRSNAASIMVSYGGLTTAEAEARLRYIDVKKQFPDTYVDDAWVDEYYAEVESSGISIGVYVEYRNQVKGITGEGKKEKRMAVIDSLPITDAQKDALYYAEGWAASRIGEAPWR